MHRRPSRGHWVNRRLDELDPETDYAEMIRLIADYKLNAFVFDLLYAFSFHYITLPATGSRAIVGTGKAEQRPQTRFLDTADALLQWMLLGPDHPSTRESVQRIQRMHEGIARTYPDSFNQEEDFVYTYAVFALATTWVREMVGASAAPRNELIAFHHFWRDISDQLHSTAGPATTFPVTVDDMIVLAEQIESRDYAPTPDGRLVSDAMIDQFNARYFPGRLQPLGRAMVLAFVSDRVQRRQQVRPANPALVGIVRTAFRALFFFQDRIFVPPRMPLSEILNSREWERERKHWRTQERSRSNQRVTHRRQLSAPA
ncbi:hypothetical protein [Skermania piniformis]|uniref:ER-bound oxygenase mpaB/mpaB'/Rubber oxygenase catalytic domain-containing protein n=2 Tax=Skermania pinensis TaxID=39122 RepID=A0ABX8S474_9ACTN|nr:hypothetical protein [Skermania piniformis]QXQ12639.1 hypothetical protein KV203_11795 [Skermania piniformis]